MENCELSSSIELVIKGCTSIILAQGPCSIQFFSVNEDKRFKLMNEKDEKSSSATSAREREFSDSSGWPLQADPHYPEEPWHSSSWPIANVLHEEWTGRFTGSAFAALIIQTARAIARWHRSPLANMASGLRDIGLQRYLTNVAPIA